MSAALIQVTKSCFECGFRIPSNGHVPDSCYVFPGNCYSGKPNEACCGAKKSAECANLQAHNNRVMQLPTWEDVYKWAIDSHGTPDLDQGRYAILRGCYDFICQQQS